MGKTVTIMQPTYLPWLGYLALMDMVDVFIYLDDIQFSKQSWQQRNYIKGPENPILLSVPISRKPSKPPINRAQIADLNFAVKHRALLKMHLGEAPFFNQALAIFDQAVKKSGASLDGLNRNFIEGVAKALGITTERKLASNLGIETDDKTQRLIDICQHLNADTYVSPPSSLVYLQNSGAFETAPVDLRYFAFDHPSYPQSYGEFRSHMSVMDALAHLELDELKIMMRKAILPTQTKMELSSEHDRF